MFHQGACRWPTQQQQQSIQSNQMPLMSVLYTQQATLMPCPFLPNSLPRHSSVAFSDVLFFLLTAVLLHTFCHALVLSDSSLDKNFCLLYSVSMNFSEIHWRQQMMMVALALAVHEHVWQHLRWHG
jgi:hypothetical protein